MTIDDPFKALLQKQDVASVLVGVWKTPDEQLKALSVRLDGADLQRLIEFSIPKIQSYFIMSHVYVGGLLHLLWHATFTEERRELYDNVVEDLEISTTKEGDMRKLFRVWGGVLLSEVSLVRQFPLESLKLLARDYTPQEARDAAIELAKAGERVSIQKAEDLIEEFGGVAEATEPPEPEATETDLSEKPKASKRKKKRTAKPSKPLWGFTGDVVKVVLQPLSSSVRSDIDTALKDFEAAFEAFTTEYATVIAPSKGDHSTE